jgi:hypothetical protein
MSAKISSIGVVSAISPAQDVSLFVSQKKNLKLMNRASQLAIAAAKMATQSIDPAQLSDAGLFLGVGMSGGELASLSNMLSESMSQDGTLDLLLMGERGLSRVNPLLSFHVLNNMPLCHLSIELGVRGPHGAFYCEDAASGLRALSRAADCVTRGEAPIALAGGADSLLDTINLALSTHKRPSEGAAIVLFSSVGDILWRGLSEAYPTKEEALRSLTEHTPAIQLDADASEPFGDTQAASASLWVARAVELLRAAPIGADAAIFAQNRQGFSVALLSRCQ